MGAIEMSGGCGVQNTGVRMALDDMGYQVPIPQVATLQPFTVMIQYKNNF